MKPGETKAERLCVHIKLYVHKNRAFIVVCVQEYPFKAQKQHSLDYVRQFPHLRPRTLFFGALLRIRNAATMAAHKYFQVSDKN